MLWGVNVIMDYSKCMQDKQKFIFPLDKKNTLLTVPSKEVINEIDKGDCRVRTEGDFRDNVWVFFSNQMKCSM